jgi:hypothetical protein
MKTKYEGHEDMYQKCQAQPKRVGWDDAKQLAVDVASMERVLQWSTFPKAGKVLELGYGAGNICISCIRVDILSPMSRFVRTLYIANVSDSSLGRRQQQRIAVLRSATVRNIWL